MGEKENQAWPKVLEIFKNTQIQNTDILLNTFY